MRRILTFLLLVGSCLAQTTTYTGTVKDLTNTAVTSGQVSFALQPGIDTTISGTARFVPTTTYCTITALGAIKALDGIAACTLTNNTALTPTGTSYKVCIQAAYSLPGSCFNVYALGGSVDLTTVVPTPGTAPAYTFFDLISAQTVTGAKTWAADLVPDADNTRSFGSDTFGWVIKNGHPKKFGSVRYAEEFPSFQAAVTDATGGGEVWVTGSVAIPDNVSIPSTVALKIKQGGLLTVASGKVVTISGDFDAGTYQVFAGSGTVAFSSKQARSVRPEWWGAVADANLAVTPIAGTDNLAAIHKAIASLPETYIPTQGAQLLESGRNAKTGKVLLSLGGYVVSDTLILSPFVSYECPSYNGCPIILQNGVATSGSEKFTVKVDPVMLAAVATPNVTYGAVFKNVSVDCNGGKYYGTNVKASGVKYAGAQGSSPGSVRVSNCGLRGWVDGADSANLSGNGGPADIWVIGVTTGPGVQIDAGVAHYSSIRSEAVNVAGSNVDADGDANAALLIGSSSSNGAANVVIDSFGAELDGLPIKVWGGAGITITNAALGAKVGGQATGVIIDHAAKAVKIGTMFSFAATPDVFTNFVVDRVNTITVPSTGSFPAASYSQPLSPEYALTFVSKQATGSAPIAVDSTTKVANLNVDQVDGLHLFKLSATLSPASVAANTCAEETYTVTGVATGDVLFVNKPTAQAGLGVAGVRAVGTNQAAINFCNTTAAPIVPTASQAYSFGVIR